MGKPWALGLGTLSLLAAVFCLFFFRDFDRSTRIDDSMIYSPGDGRILEVNQVKEGEHSGWMIIRIFLSVFDGHVQRSPVSGTVTKIEYQKGLFLDARDPQAHIQNEQNTVVVESVRGPVIVKQVAGLIARRIVCWVRAGDRLEQGQRYGLIRFGSQVDVLIPGAVEAAVVVGDRVLGGETVLARWKA